MKDSNFKPVARTMSDAFGPGARLDIKSERLPGTRLIPWAVCGMVAALFLYGVFG